MDKKTKIAIFATILLIIIIGTSANILLSQQQTAQPKGTFSVTFNLMEANQTLRSLPVQFDTWQIRVYQNNQETLRNVDVWVNSEIVRHYDYLTNRMGTIEEATVISGKSVSVLIYWESGQENFHSP